MMNRQDMHEKLIDYYNGHLEGQEKEEFEKHLAECPDCREELDEWEALNAELVHGLESVEPPSDMKDRVLTTIFDEESEESQPTEAPAKSKPKPSIYKKWMIPLAAALLLSLIGNIYLWMNQQETGSLSESLMVESETMTLSPASESLEMNARMSMREDNGQQTLVMQAENFTNLEEGAVYQVWLLEGEEPYRAGTFVPNEDGEGYVVFTMDDSEDIDWDMVAITMEPSPQNQAPEGDILMSGEF